MASDEREYDVLVCGGGVAGVAAALEAARAGCRTALVEKTILLGGLATAGLILAYPPLCDRAGRQVTRGLAEELRALSCRYGPGELPPDPEPPGHWVLFSPAAFALALDEALLEAKVELWLDTLACQPMLNGQAVVGVETETKSGRLALRAHVVVDATGDADIAHRAGAPCVEAGNLMAVWALQVSLQNARKAVAQNDGSALLQAVQQGEDLGDQEVWAGAKTWSGLSAEGVTAFVLEGRRLLRAHYRRAQSQPGSDRRQIYPITLPSMAQFRTTRRIVGRAEITAGDRGRERTDSVGLVADWRRFEEVWEIPYGALVPARVRGVLAAGRCIAAEEDPWEATRVIHAAALTGQVAGLAAGLAAARGVAPDEVGADELQARLQQKGVPYHVSQV